MLLSESRWPLADNRQSTFKKSVMPDNDYLIFPTVRGTNLADGAVVLPAAFEGVLNLVFIAFKRFQAPWVNTWMPEANALTTEYPELQYYRLPTIAFSDPHHHSSIDQGMRVAIELSEELARVITLYLDKSAFRGALGLPDEETIYVLLIDREGRVLWRTEGAYTPQKARLLQHHVGEAFKSHAVPDASP